MTISWFKYVRHYDVPRWAALGWEATGGLQGTGHGDYSELMRWNGCGEMVVPEDEEEKAVRDLA